MFPLYRRPCSYQNSEKEKCFVLLIICLDFSLRVATHTLKKMVDFHQQGSSIYGVYTCSGGDPIPTR